MLSIVFAYDCYKLDHKKSTHHNALQNISVCILLVGSTHFREFLE